MDFPFSRSAAVFAATAFALAIAAPLAAAAQDDSAARSSAADGTGVARLSIIDGNVAVQRGDSGNSLSAAPNTPLLGGDYVTTGDSSRAEIQLDGYAHVRLDGDVQLRFTHLDTTERSLQLAAGTVELRLLDGPDAVTTIDTPSIAIAARSGGRYRVSVTPDGQTRVTVRSGEAEIDSPQGARDLTPGSTLVATGDADIPAIVVQKAIAFDDFDRFNSDRDGAEAPVAAQAAYVNPAIGGVADLSAYGSWVTDGAYGHVWVPAAVGPGWAPYRTGRWVWEEGYGWTWLADEPWGWAPYHYGSWYNSSRYGWCWYPPRPHVYTPWRPALVAFIGFGVGSGIALDTGSYDRIGWVPLAPFEPYNPWWKTRYGNHTTINNTTTITNVTNNITVYRNARSGAASSVSSRRFLEGDFSRTSAVTAPQLHAARVFHGALPMVPTASNLRFAHATQTPAVAVRPALMHHPFAGNRTVVGRTPFTTQRAALATAAHTPLTPLHVVPPNSASSGGPPNAWSRFNTTHMQGDAAGPRRVPQASSQSVPAAHPYISAPPAGAHHPPGETHHAQPGETHHVQPGETHHVQPGETHHVQPGETHHVQPGETHHVQPGETHHVQPGETHHGARQAESHPQ
jgi:hypothetical protein